MLIRPNKKINMFHVRLFAKKEKEGLFIFYFLFFKMADFRNFNQFHVYSQMPFTSIDFTRKRACTLSMRGDFDDDKAEKARSKS